KDVNNNIDLDFTDNVRVSSTGTLTGDPVSVAAVSGVATFSSLVHTASGTGLTLTAERDNSGAWDLDVTSTTFDVTNPQPEINIKQNVTNILTTGTYAFGNVISGTSSAVTTFTIENLGTADLTLTGSPKVVISGTNASEFTINETTTTSPVIASGSTTFTITFSPTTQGSKTAAISIANNDTDENPYVINLTGTGTVSTTSDIINTAGYSYTSNVDYASFQTATTLTTANSVGANGLTIRDGGAGADADNLGTILTAISFTIGSSTAIRTAALFDGTTNVAEVAVNGATTITFPSVSLTASDNGTKDFELRVTYLSTVTDNEQITFTVSSATASVSGSNFGTGDAGAAASSTTSNINRIEVFTTQLVYTQQPSNATINVAMTPAVTVAARDANANTDLDFTDNVRVSSTGTLTGSPVSVVTVSGVATFSTLTHTATGTGLTLLAERDNSGAWDLDITSTTFDVNAVSSATDFFRSNVATGNWATASSWETSPTGSDPWITSTLVPNSSANTITIRNGHNISTSGTLSGDQIIIENGGTLTNGSGTTFTLNDGTGDDLSIENGGTIIYNVTSGVPTFTASANIRVKTGGVISIRAGGLTALGTGVNSATHVYNNGSILEWNLATGNPSSSGITFFPNVVQDTIPIFRFATSTSGGTYGAAAQTTFNGKLEIGTGVTVTFIGTGTKTFRNGIIGSGNMTQGTSPSICGQILITGTGGDELGGSGTITLNTNGLSIATGATATLSSDKTINTNTISVAGTLSTSTFQLAGSSAVSVTSTGTLKGSGTVNGIVTLSGKVSPGASPGTLNTGAFTFNTNSTYVFEMGSATGTAGTDWDEIISSGGITISASPITIDLTSFSTTNFNQANPYTWLIATGTSITGLGSSFTVSTTNFTPTFTGTFSVTTNSTEINLVYTPSGCTVPSITSILPATQTLCQLATPADISVSATGDGLTYEWFSNTTNSNSGGTTTGITTSTY
ncbi:MAG: choice-of-anchor D domain-containing protein, partial [Saprospiraceae bacterium]